MIADNEGETTRLARGVQGGYKCSHLWPDDCFVQCGTHGLVFPSGHLEKVIAAKDPIAALSDACADEKTYTTAFFEAFPKNPDTFIRGEGKTVAEAEDNAWTQYRQYIACSGHEYERRGYTNGGGICKNCGMFGSRVFEKQVEEQ